MTAHKCARPGCAAPGIAFFDWRGGPPEWERGRTYACSGDIEELRQERIAADCSVLGPMEASGA